MAAAPWRCAAPPHALRGVPQVSAPSRKRQRARKPAADAPAAAEEGDQAGEQEGEPGVAPHRLARAVKNRLSAARSRQRRLAYTAELETIVAALREENEQLKAEVERLKQGRS